MSTEPTFTEAEKQRLSQIVTDLQAALPRQRIKAIITEEAAKYGVTYEEVMSRAKVRGASYREHGVWISSKPIAQARQAAMAAIRDTIIERGRPISYPRLALIFKRDHSTVMDGVRRHRASIPQPMTVDN